MALAILYALICTGIVLRVVSFDRQGGQYRALPAYLALLLCSAAGSVPLRLLFGLLPPPSLATVVLSAALLCALIKTRGSVYQLLPRRLPSPLDIVRRPQP